MKSQNELILKFLQTHKTGITPLQALEKFGSLRLSSRIYDLREAGYKIMTNRIDVKDRNGEIKSVAQYRLVR